MAGPGPNASTPPELRLWDPFYNVDGWSDRFFPFLTRGFGLNPSAGDLDGDGYDEILVGPGPGPSETFGSHVRGWNFDGEQVAWIERMSFLLFEEGEYVAGAKLAFGNFYQPPPFVP